MRSLLLIIIFTFVVKFSLYSQSKKNDLLSNLSIESNYLHGFIFDHRNTLGFVLNDHINSFDIAFVKKTYGTKPWHQLYNYPRVGFGYFYSDFKNPEVLGVAHALFSKIYFPLVSRPKLDFTFSIGLGLGYINKKFDFDNNYYNVLISSKLNGFYNFNFDLRKKIGEKAEIIGGLNIIHFSNGATNTPNLGLNLISTRLGFAYLLGQTKEPIKIELSEYKKHYVLSTVYSAGIRELDAPGGLKYFVTTLSFNAEKYLNYKNRIGIGLDLFYDESLIYVLEVNNERYNSDFDFFYTGVHFSYGLSLDKLSFFIDNGFYIYTKAKQQGFVYQRIGLRYDITEKWFANVSFKTYFAAAEFIEWGVGFKIN